MTDRDCNECRQRRRCRLVQADTHQDHVLAYTGQHYGQCDARALQHLAELARTNRLHLCQRHTASRNVRITMPPTMTSNSPEATSEEEERRKFWHNFSKVAKACYLTLMRASPDTWAEQRIHPTLAAQAETSAHMAPCDMRDFNESLIRYNLMDEEFTAAYVRLIVSLHDEIVDKLIRSSPPVALVGGRCGGEEFGHADPVTIDSHVFRSFRIVCLRYANVSNNKSRIRQDEHRRASFDASAHVMSSSSSSSSSSSCNTEEAKPKGNCSMPLEPRLNEVLEIRVSFDIRRRAQGNTSVSGNDSSYDCCVESEISFYSVKSADECAREEEHRFKKARSQSTGSRRTTATTRHRHEAHAYTDDELRRLSAFSQSRVTKPLLTTFV